MFKSPHRNYVWGLCALALLAQLLHHQGLPPIRADVGVQPILPGGSSILPKTETPIEMAAEVVEITVRESTPADNELVTLTPDYYGRWSLDTWYPAVAEVSADFDMFNPTDQAIEMLVWFPLASALDTADWALNPEEIVPRLSAFQVSANGTALATTEVELPNPQGSAFLPLPWASFTVRFPALEHTHIHVAYQLPLAPAIKGNEMILYYIFQTGAGWAGSIGQADLIINLPYPASAATLSGMAPAGLRLPYYSIPQHRHDLPSGVVMEGSQARWTWTDFEPGPADDFSIFLLLPHRWQALEAAREQVRMHPQDGEAWLELASLYHLLSVSYRNTLQTFSDSYLPQGIEAYQQAITYLPEHPVPHAGWALLNLVPYLAEDSGTLPPALLVQIEEELDIARELGAQHPELVPEGIYGSAIEMVDAALLAYANRQATQTPTPRASQTATSRPTMVKTLPPSPTATPCAATNTPTQVSAAVVAATAAPVSIQRHPPLPFLVIGAAALLVAAFAWAAWRLHRRQ